MKALLLWGVAILPLPISSLLLLLSFISPTVERWYFKDIEEEQYL